MLHPLKSSTQHLISASLQNKKSSPSPQMMKNLLLLDRPVLGAIEKLEYIQYAPKHSLVEPLGWRNPEIKAASA